MEPDLTKVESLASIEAELPEYKDEIRTMRERADDYIRTFPWCRGITETRAGIVIPGVVGVFLHRIIPAHDGVDDWVWSIIGDVPPAYISLDDAPNPATALDGYIGAMQDWVEAVRLGRPLDDVIPVDVPPEPKFAAMLESRLNYLSQLLDADYAEDLEV